MTFDVASYANSIPNLSHFLRESSLFVLLFSFIQSGTPPADCIDSDNNLPNIVKVCNVDHECPPQYFIALEQELVIECLIPFLRCLLYTMCSMLCITPVSKTFSYFLKRRYWNYHIFRKAQKMQHILVLLLELSPSFKSNQISLLL